MMKKMLVLGFVAALFVAVPAQAATLNFAADNFVTTGSVVDQGNGVYLFYGSDAALSFDVYASPVVTDPTEQISYNLWVASQENATGGGMIVLEATVLANGPTGTLPAKWNDQLNFTFGYNEDVFFTSSQTAAGDVNLYANFTASDLTGAYVADKGIFLGSASVVAVDGEIVFGPEMGWYVDFGMRDGGTLTLNKVGNMASSLVLTTAPSGLAEVVVPEPGTYAMLCGLGLIGAAWYRRNKKAK